MTRISLQSRFSTRSVRPALALAVFVALAVLGACKSDGVSANPIAGSYTATRFDVTPPGQPVIDVKGGGGTFAITIAENNTTSGLVRLPPATTGLSVDFTVDMNGTAVVTGNTMKFSQPTTDSFVRDLVWTINGRTLVVTNQQLNGAQFNIVLTR